MTDAHAMWLTERRTGLGASDVPAIVGASPWRSPWSVWADKVGLSPLETADSLAMRLGRELEPTLAALFEEATGFDVVERQAVVRRGEFARATLDGYVATYDGDGQTPTRIAVFESKTTKARPWQQVPADVNIQVQWQLYVTGMSRAYVAVLHRVEPAFEIHELTRDDELILELEKRCGEFWEYVKSEQPPPVDSTQATANVLDDMFPVEQTTDDSVDIAPVAHVIDAWRDYQREQRGISDAIEQCRNEIRLALGDREVGTLDGETVVTWKPTTRMMVDAKKLRAEHGDRYDKPLTFRTLRLTTKREEDE